VTESINMPNKDIRPGNIVFCEEFLGMVLSTNMIDETIIFQILWPDIGMKRTPPLQSLNHSFKVVI